MNLTHLYKSLACEVVKSSCIEISRSSKLYTWIVKGNTIFSQAFRENYTIYEGKFKTRSELLATRCEESDFTKPWLENSLWLQTLYLMALGGKLWQYLPHCAVLWPTDCPETSYPSRGSRVDCQRKKEQGEQRHLSCEQANNEGTVPNYIGYNTSKIPWLVLSSTQQDTTLVPGLSLDCACEMLESCSLECQNVAKKIAKNPISCFLNFKSYYLNFLIFLYKR